MYGWRGRIGIIIPSSNTTCEPELQTMAPDGVSVHAARVFNPEVKNEAEKEAAILQMNREIERAAREVASVEPAVIVYGCTTGSFLKGPGYDQEVEEKIVFATGIQALTTTTAVVEAIKALGLRKIAMATPYTSGTASKERDFIEKVIPGLTVAAEKNLELISNLARGKLFPFTAYRAVREVVTPEADGVFISCTNWRTIEIIDTLERDLGRPVVTSNQASLWFALKKMRMPGNPKYGQIFSCI
jgi:maleate isomerase